MNHQTLYRRQDDITGAEKASRLSGQINDEPSCTLQSPALDSDINAIAKAYGLTARGGMPVPPEALDARYYGDMTEIPETLQEAIALVEDAAAKFAALPVDIRNRFNHNPAALWNFVQDDRNLEEARRLGLLVTPPPADPPPATP